MRQLQWGKLPDAKIKGTIWEKDVTDEHVKVRSPLRASEGLLSASDDLGLPCDESLSAVDASECVRMRRNRRN